MGKIIAVGGGFGGEYSDFLVRHVMEVCGKEKPNFLTIPTTCYDNFDTQFYSRFFNLGCSVDVLKVTADYTTEQMIADKIGRADVIQVPGGNLRFVAEKWKETRADKYLAEAYAQGKVLFGASSGAMCWFREGYDDCGPENAFMFVPALDLLPYCYCPHYESPYWQSFNQAVTSRKISGIGCENDAALCFIDGERYILHSPERVDARCWYFDAGDNFKRYDLDANSDLLKSL